MCIPVHSPWLPGYIDVTQTVTLTMAGLLLDRSYIFSVQFDKFSLLPYYTFLLSLVVTYFLFLFFSGYPIGDTAKSNLITWYFKILSG